MDILPTLPKVDAVITDPPYGINFNYESYEDTKESLINLINHFIPWGLQNSDRIVVLCGITQIYLYPEPTWVCSINWNTTGSFGKCGYTQWMPVLFYKNDVKGFGNVEGIITKSDSYRVNPKASAIISASREKINHPCPKPLDMMNWSVARFSLKNEIVLDPFMGSGTTGVAAIQMGRKFIGIEREPKYFEIACKRIEQAVAQPQLFEPEPVKQTQESMF